MDDGDSRIMSRSGGIGMEVVAKGVLFFGEGDAEILYCMSSTRTLYCIVCELCIGQRLLSYE